MSDGPSISFDAVTSTPDDVAATESIGAEPTGFEGLCTGDSTFSVGTAENPTGAVFSGIPVEMVALAPFETDPNGTAPVGFELDDSTGSVSLGMPAEPNALAPAEIDPDDKIPTNVGFDGANDSVFPGLTGRIDALAFAEVASGTLDVESTELDSSAVFDFSEATIPAPPAADSLLLGLVALFSPSDVGRLDADTVGRGIIGRMGVVPTLFVALTSEVPPAEMLDVISSGLGLERLALLVAAAGALKESSLDCDPVILGSTRELEDLSTGAASEVGVVVFSPDLVGAWFAFTDSDSEDRPGV